MGIALGQVERASVTTVTLRRLPRLGSHGADVTDLLVVEVLGPDGALLTGSLVDEATALVAAGLTTAEAARFNVPGFQ
jgi:hypothetical protein